MDTQNHPALYIVFLAAQLAAGYFCVKICFAALDKHLAGWQLRFLHTLNQAGLKITPLQSEKLTIAFPFAVKIVLVAALICLSQAYFAWHWLIILFCFSLALLYIWEMQKHLNYLQAVLISIPHCLDLISLALLSGHTLPSAIAQIAQLSGAGPLGAEFKTVLNKVKSGMELKVALKELTEKVGLLELQIANEALMLSYTTGGGVSGTLRDLAKRFAAERLRRAELAANRTPTLLLAPLFVCIFPSSFVVLFFPIIIRITGHN